MSNLYFKGDNIFLYVQFTADEGQVCSVDKPQVRVLHDKIGKLYEDLKWSNMQQMSDNEYFYNFKIPFTSDLGQYQVLYKGNVNGNLAHVMETFHVINKSTIYDNTIKIYGYVSDIRTEVALTETMIKINNKDTEEYCQSLTNNDGYWEAYLYPNQYEFEFAKDQYVSMKVNVQISDQQNEIQFNNIGLESISSLSKGNGMYPITDKYVTKQGMPLINLDVKIHSVIDPIAIYAQDITNDDGSWECYLDPGMYLLKVTGTTFSKQFIQTFRIKVSNDGTFSFENISKNTATASQQSYIDDGTGSIEHSDYILDKNQNPIVDVQINAFKLGTPLEDKFIIAQAYTDSTGKWVLNLDPGTYVMEYYHPKFKVITETIKLGGVI
jgi:hypothetical protein